MPQHQHLFGGPGCFENYNIPNVECQGPDALPDEWKPLPGAFEDDTKWNELIFGKPK